MIKKKNKKKNKILITLCAMFIAIASVFSFVSFSNHDNLVVSADGDISVDTTLTTFNGSPSFMPYATNTDSSVSGWYLSNTNYFGNFAFSYQFLNDKSVVNLTLRFVLPSIDTVFVHSASSNEFTNYNDKYWLALPISTGNYLHCSFSASNYQVVGNNISFVMGAPQKVTFTSYFAYGEVVSLMEYTDADNNTLTFTVLSDRSNFSETFQNSFSQRTYLLNTSLSDNQIYQLGYEDGSNSAYQPAYNEGFADGKTNGYDIGYDLGYNTGFTDGENNTNQYTFLNLVSATIDAPMKYFQSLFNFELLGVNLQGFLTGLFTLCVIVTIIKMVL